MCCLVLQAWDLQKGTWTRPAVLLHAAGCGTVSAVMLAGMFVQPAAVPDVMNLMMLCAHLCLCQSFLGNAIAGSFVQTLLETAK